MFIALWVAIGGGMFTLLMAAISKKNKGTCRDYVVTVKGDENNLFMSRQDIAILLEELVGGPVKGHPISTLNLRELENKLEQDTWIDNAELYFDNKDVLHVQVNEKIPVARIFTTNGKSFYTDSTGNTMPVSDKRSARLPVFTGFPHKTKWSARDSLLLQQISEAANFIVKDAFWNAQVSQIDILPDRSLEMIPVVGDHRVKLGNAENIPAKFRRLYVFYQQVLSKTGLNAYRQIDVQYKGQVVASQYTATSKVDSVQLRKNVEKLLRKAREADFDTTATIRPAPVTKLPADEEAVTKPDLPLENNKDPNPVKTTSVSPERTPKAVMPKKTGGEDRQDQ